MSEAFEGYNEGGKTLTAALIAFNPWLDPHEIYPEKN